LNFIAAETARKCLGNRHIISKVPISRELLMRRQCPRLHMQMRFR